VFLFLCFRCTVHVLFCFFVFSCQYQKRLVSEITLMYRVGCITIPTRLHLTLVQKADLSHTARDIFIMKSYKQYRKKNRQRPNYKLQPTKTANHRLHSVNIKLVQTESTITDADEL